MFNSIKNSDLGLFLLILFCIFAVTNLWFDTVSLDYKTNKIPKSK